MADRDVAELLRRVEAVEGELNDERSAKASLEDTVAGLQTEVKDQQEAIDAMMDMLEKTITVEDTNDMLDELDSRLQQSLGEHTSSIAEIHEDMSGLHDKLEASAEHIVSRLDKVSSDVRGDTSRLEQQIRTAESALADAS